MDIRQDCFDIAPEADDKVYDPLREALEEYIDEETGDEIKDIVESDDEYVVKDRSHAEYFVRMYNRAKAESEKIAAAADDYVKKHTEMAERWKAKNIYPQKLIMDYASDVLQDYAERELAGSKKKSLSLIGGTLAFRAQQPKYDYDDDLLRGFLAASHKDLLKPQPASVDHAGLKKLGKIGADGTFLLDGKAVPGVMVTPREPSFSIKEA